jgi:hypothetical protein
MSATKVPGGAKSCVLLSAALEVADSLTQTNTGGSSYDIHRPSMDNLYTGQQ